MVLLSPPPPTFSLVPMKSISLTRVETKSFIFCHNRYAAQNKLPMHHSLPECISLGSGGPISKSKSTNQFCMTIQGHPLCWHHVFLPTLLVWEVLSHGCLSTGKLKLCISTNLRHSLTSISTKTLFSSANIQSWFVFFPFHVDALFRLSPPRGCSYPGHTGWTHKIDTQRENEIFQQEK